jgi:hypothetical protein
MKIECRMQQAERRRPPQAALRLTHQVPRFPGAPSRIPLPATRHSPLATRRLERGVALVITLLLLSVITFMAITFLVVSHTERGSVATQTDLTIARLAADTARDRAIVETITPIMATTNPFNYGLLVSANYINPKGFDPSQAPSAAPDPQNVNYDFKFGSAAPFTDLEWQRNIANLWNNPRPPVVVVTNSSPLLPGQLSNEFRFYVDINRNRMFDPTGLLMQTNDLRQSLGFSSFETGDPQWIGILQHPEFPHSADNLFVSRYAFFVVPVGQSLDINAIHNFAKFQTRAGMNGAVDGFVRNQGILPSEINLAALLADVNTNLWPSTAASAFGFPLYSYNVDLTQPANLAVANTGAAFDDAVGILTYRYNYNYTSLANVLQLFGNAGGIAFTNPIDAYAAGPLMTGTWWPAPFLNPNATRVGNNYPWSGAYNPNAFFSPQDLFDESKTAANIPVNTRPSVWTFTKRLLAAGTNNSSYNRTTFSRLASQLGT